MATKSLTVYTSTSDRTKKLKSPVQILLTLMPKSSKSAKPIAWKVLTFPSNVHAQKSVKFYTEFGFSTFNTTYDDVLQADNTVPVKAGQKATFSPTPGGVPKWDVVETVEEHGKFAIALNKSEAPRDLVLCCVNEYDQIFEPLVRLPTLMNGKSVKTGPPVMLQAYAVAGCKEGQLFQQDVAVPLLEAIDIGDLRSSAAFQLYSDRTGKIVLERQHDDSDDSEDDE